MSGTEGHDEKGSWCCFPIFSSPRDPPENKVSEKQAPIAVATQNRGDPWPESRSSDEGLLMDKRNTVHRIVISQEPPQHPRPTPIPEKAPVQHTPANISKQQCTPTKSISNSPKRSKFSCSKSTPQRPTISAPMHFRHVDTGSPSSKPAFAEAVDIRPGILQRRPSCPQLELNFHSERSEKGKKKAYRCESLPPRPRMWERQARDLFDTPPSPTSTMGSGMGHRRWVSTSSLMDMNRSMPNLHPPEYERSFSSLSFHFPRKATADNGDSRSVILEDDLPASPRSSARSRPRALTAPKMERPNEQVATMIRIGTPQKPNISDIKRHSLCVDYEVDCPRTPVAKSHARKHALQGTVNNNPSRLAAPVFPRVGGSRIPLPPPLPPMLRQQTRKRKSLSQVSHWLFSESESSLGVPTDPVTNLPPAVTIKDILHEYALLANLHSRRHSRRHSYGSINTVTTFHTDDHRGSLSSWSLNSSSVIVGNEYYVPKTFAPRRHRMSSPLASVGLAV